jgi:hypothetical protein
MTAHELTTSDLRRATNNSMRSRVDPATLTCEQTFSCLGR